jgi:hypothetical protein
MPNSLVSLGELHGLFRHKLSTFAESFLLNSRLIPILYEDEHNSVPESLDLKEL